MHFRALRLSIALVVLTLTLYSTPKSTAQYRGEFFGSYQISNVEESGDQVQLTIKVILQNYSGQEVQGGGVVLYDTAPVHSALGAFSGINSLPANGKVALTQEFTVSKTLYAAWKQGEKPVMEMLLPSPDGSSRLERIDLAPAPSPVVPTE
jgi:hypothetical protein